MQRNERWKRDDRRGIEQSRDTSVSQAKHFEILKNKDLWLERPLTLNLLLIYDLHVTPWKSCGLFESTVKQRLGSPKVPVKAGQDKNSNSAWRALGCGLISWPFILPLTREWGRSWEAIGVKPISHSIGFPQFWLVNGPDKVTKVTPIKKPHLVFLQ